MARSVASKPPGIRGARSRFIDAGGIRTHYWEAGKGETVIMLHGGGAGADGYINWHGVIAPLGRHFRAIAIDMVGYGDTDCPDPAGFTYSQDARNQHLVAFIEALDCGPVHLIGNSLGGITSIGATIARPDLVKKLVLMGSAGLQGRFNPALQAVVDYDFTVEGMRRMIQGLMKPGDLPDEGIVRYRHARSLDAGRRRAGAAIQAWLGEHQLIYPDDYFRQIPVPTLIIQGKNDVPIPVSCAYRFLELIPQSWGLIIPDCGHWAMIEYPETFVGTVESFLHSPA